MHASELMLGGEESLGCAQTKFLSLTTKTHVKKKKKTSFGLYTEGKTHA